MKKRIVQLFKIYWPDNGGGIATVMEDIADGFRDWDQDIVVCQNEKGKPTADDVYHGVRVHRSRQMFTAASTPLSVRYLSDVKKYTRDADIVIYHFPYPMIDLAVWLGMCAGKLVVWWHCEPEKAKKLLPVYGPFIRHTLKKADRILVSSEGNIDNSDFLQPYRDKCTVIPFCVGDDYLMEGEQCALKQGDINKEEINILFIGRLVWYKGCDILLEAFAAMKHKHCKLTLVGGGPMEGQLKSMAAALNIDAEFTGIISEEEKKKRIAGSDFLVLPSISRAEAFAIVQLEAMAFGKPVINTNLPSGVPHVSKDGVTGITVEPGNVKQLTEAMDRLAGDGELRETYGKNGYRLVRKEYTKELMASRHREVFQKLTGV